MLNLGSPWLAHKLAHLALSWLVDLLGGKRNRRIKIGTQLKVIKCNAIMMKAGKHVKAKFQFNSIVSLLFVQHLQSN